MSSISHMHRHTKRHKTQYSWKTENPIEKPLKQQRYSRTCHLEATHWRAQYITTRLNAGNSYIAECLSWNAPKHDFRPIFGHFCLPESEEQMVVPIDFLLVFYSRVTNRSAGMISRSFQKTLWPKFSTLCSLPQVILYDEITCGKLKSVLNFGQ